MLQTIHKLYTKPYIEPYTKLYTTVAKPYTASVQNPTQRAFAKLYTKRNTDPTFCLMNTNCSRMELEREWSEWSESYVTFVTNVTKVTNVTNVTNVKQEMAIGGDAPRHSCAPKNPTILSVFSAIRH